MKRCSWFCAIVFVLMATAPASAQDFAERRAELLREIGPDVEATIEHLMDEEMDPRVMQAMGDVPRHEFVPERLQGKAYANRPLPIGHGQTISQPYIVALMTGMLDLEPDDVVFEVGTGSAYQAAVLGGLVAEVHTVEIIPELAESAAERLERLGYDNVHVRQGDGYYGLPEKAPFDAIMVTAAAEHIPPPLVEQLAPGARMAIPVGPPHHVQHLMLVEKDEEGEVRTRSVLAVSFVPLTGEH
jgi:protein-L-isoaspartate(D-aspartate) O-methyltransferase